MTISYELQEWLINTPDQWDELARVEGIPVLAHWPRTRALQDPMQLFPKWGSFIDLLQLDDHICVCLRVAGVGGRRFCRIRGC